MKQFLSTRLKTWMSKVGFSTGLLLILVVVAAVLRLSLVDTWRLNSDEMSIGYNAFSILQTGRDEWGRQHPLIFQAFGDFKLPVYIYSVVPFVAIFGLTPLAVKLPSMIAGTLLVVLMYSLAKQLTHSRSLGLLTAILMAINPWSLHLSKMALESNLALMLFVLGLNLLIYQLKHRKASAILSLLVGLLFGFTLYTYVAYRLIMVLMGIMFIVLWLTKKSWRRVLTFVIIGLVAMSSLWVVQLVKGSGSVRFNQLFVTQHQGTEALLVDKHNFCFLVDRQRLSPVCRRVFISPTETIRGLIQNYTRALSPEFLFLIGDPVRYLHTPGYGQLLLIFAPGYFFGLAYWLATKQDTLSRMMVVIFLMTPVSAALVGSPQNVRLSALLPFVILFTAFGIWSSVRLISRFWLKLSLIGLFAFISALFVIRFLIDFLFIYPLQQESHFYPVGPELVRYVTQVDDKYDLIYVTDDFPDAHILFAFWEQLSPVWYQQNVVRPDADSFGFQHPVRLGKLVFGPRRGPSFFTAKRDQNILYITSNDDLAVKSANNKKTTKLFRDFSGVHVEAKVVDVAQFSQQLARD